MKAKVALITGSTSGIGLEIARTFARNGFSVVFHGLEPKGEEIARQFAEDFHVKTLYSSANLQLPSEIDHMVAEVCSELGSVDVLINNAGIQFVSPIEDFPLNKWNDIISVNLSAAFCTSKAVWADMKVRRWGRIINIASAHGLQASEFKSAYVASKHGLIGLTKVLALEGAEYGITANAICPGYVKTSLVEKQIADLIKSHHLSEEEVLQKIILQKHAIKEFVSADAIAALALYLASDQASMITGTSMPVDGGWGAQ